MSDPAPSERYGFSGRLSESFPSQLVLDVTEQCNLACIHCSHAEYKKGPLYSGCHMPADIHAKLVREAAAEGKGALRYIRYTAMGEPLLHPGIYDFLNLAVRESGTTVSLTTNGTLLDARAVSRLFDAGVHIVDISLDAFSPEAYSRVRRGGDLAKTRAKVLHFLRERDRLGMPVKIVVTFIDQPANAGEAEQFSAFWKAEGTDYVIIRRLHSNAGSQGERAQELLDQSRDVRRRPCVYPWERLVLHPDGRLSFCPANWTHQGTIDHFSRISISRAWQGAFMTRLRQAHLENDYAAFSLCASCPDWAQIRWPHEDRSFADMVAELQK